MNVYDYRPRIIGYLCQHGHFDFHADDEFDHSCGSKWIGKVTVQPTGPFFASEDDAPDWWPQVLAQAEDHLAEQIKTWRNQ